MKNSPPFVHLHMHSQYSLLESAITIPKLLEQIKQLGMSSVALTDSSNMFGAYEFYEKAKAYDIKPIFGAEIYYLTGGSLESRDAKRKDHFLANLILLVQDREGYQNLCELLSIAHLKGFYYKARLDKETLKKYSRGLFAISGTLWGEVHRRFLLNEPEKAKESLEQLQDIFLENFYLEIQDHQLPLEKKVNPMILELAQSQNVPLLLTNDCKYLQQEDHQAQVVLTCIQSGRTLHEEEERGETPTDQRYVKSPAEMAKLFPDQPQAMANSLSIAERCNFGFTDKSYHFPQFKAPADISLDDFFRLETENGFQKRLSGLKNRVSEADAFEDLKKKYSDRLVREIETILQMGFAGYFLIVADFIQYAKSQKIPVGPGRGSAAGSLVAYCLEITDIDPMPYDLLFERFLNPERISMPDMDIDFCMDRRDEVIRYVAEKYGHVAQIITFGKMKAKAVIRDVGRVLDLPYSEVDKIAKLIPNTLNITLEQAIKMEPRLQELEKQQAPVRRLLEIARSLEGVTRHASMHAAGVVIADRPLTYFCPLYKGPNHEVITQFDMKAVESVGLVKFDFLGLKTLTVLDDCVKIILEHQNKKIDYADIPLDDPQVYQKLCQADALGIFQLESSGMRDLLTRLKPSCFEDIIALVALYRPGPLGSGMVDDFINRKHGRTEISYELEALRPILESTYGVIVYQEQVMQIASALADFSLGDADLLRRAMGKKKPEEMAQQRENFLKGAAHKKIPKDMAKRIFDLMAKFAEYGFNKSHSAAYALVSYYTSYFKTNYTVEYLTCLLTHEMSNTDKMLLYINDCRDHQIQILPPDVNESRRNFWVSSPEQIRFGLAGVKGVGDAAISSIIEEREKEGPFSSLFDFCARVDLRRVNKKVFESLIKSGAFDAFSNNRAQLFHALDLAMEWGAKRREDLKSGQTTMFDLMPRSDSVPKLPPVLEWKENEKLSFEKEVLGFYISGHPLDRYREQLKRWSTFDTEHLREAIDKSEVNLCGIISTLKEIRTKKGARMAFLTLEDLVGSVEVVVFSELYENRNSLFKADQSILVKGNVDISEESVKILAREVISLEEAQRQHTQAVHLRIEQNILNDEALKTLRGTLEKFPGELPIFLHLIREQGQATILELPFELRVTLNEDFKFEIQKLLGNSALYF